MARSAHTRPAAGGGGSADACRRGAHRLARTGHARDRDAHGYSHLSVSDQDAVLQILDRIEHNLLSTADAAEGVDRE